MFGSHPIAVKNAVGFMLALLGMTVSELGLNVTVWVVSLEGLIKQAILLITGIGCFFSAATIAFSSFKTFKKEHLEQAKTVFQNTQTTIENTAAVEDLKKQIRKERDERAAEAALALAREHKVAEELAIANGKAERAHDLAHRIAIEAEARVALAKQEADLEIRALRDQIARLDTEYLNQIKDVRHDVRDVKNEITIEKQVRERLLTPCPDADPPPRSHESRPDA